MFNDEIESTEKQPANGVRAHFEVEVSDDRVFARIGGVTAVMENCSDVIWLRKAIAQLIIQHCQHQGEAVGQTNSELAKAAILGRGLNRPYGI